MTFSKMPSIIAKLHGEKLLQQPLNWVFQHQHFLLPLHFTMDTVPNDYLQTSFKHKETTLGLTRTSFYQTPASFTTLIGPDMVEMFLRRRTMPNAFSFSFNSAINCYL